MALLWAFQKVSYQWREYSLIINPRSFPKLADVGLSSSNNNNEEMSCIHMHLREELCHEKNGCMMCIITMNYDFKLWGLMYVVCHEHKILL